MDSLIRALTNRTGLTAAGRELSGEGRRGEFGNVGGCSSGEAFEGGGQVGMGVDGEATRNPERRECIDQPWTDRISRMVDNTSFLS